MFSSFPYLQSDLQVGSQLAFQKGQIFPGMLLSLGLASGLGVTATPAMTDFIDKAELVSITHAHSALSSSLQINHLLASSNTITIEGKKVTLKHGFPIAKTVELEKMASFGTQRLIDNTNNTVTIWSLYKSYCFTYTESKNDGSKINSAKLSDVSVSSDSVCTTL